MMGYGGEGFGWMMGGGLMMLLVWIAPIALIVWGAAGLRERKRPSRLDQTPLEILRRRYASGEISQEEFDQARRVLG